MITEMKDTREKMMVSDKEIRNEIQRNQTITTQYINDKATHSEKYIYYYLLKLDSKVIFKK